MTTRDPDVFLLPALWGRSPRWLRLLIAVVAVVLGGAILLRPMLSLEVLARLIGAGLILQGVLEVGAAVRRPAAERRFGRFAFGMAALWIAAGVLVLVFPGPTVRLLPIVVGAGLLVSGLLSVLRAFRGQRTIDARIAAGAFGLAGVVFGVLAVVWPDSAALVIAVMFAASLIIWAVKVAWRTLRRAPAVAEPKPVPGLFRRWVRAGVAVVTVLAAVALGLATVAVHRGTPSVDAFYAAPRDLPEAPGQLIRAESFTRGVPADAEAWRILYTTTRGNGSPAIASGIVVVPRDGAGSWPVVAWHHGTTGFAQNCAPTLLGEPFVSGALYVLPQVIEQGWALVATDYIGLGTPDPHPYLIGPDSARASLDAVRAARQLQQANISDRTVAWGHSQGGAAALWTGAIAGQYAPDVKLSGVAALAPAANLPALVDHLPNVTGGSVVESFAVAAYTADYPDVTHREYIRPGAEPIIRAMAGRCLGNPDATMSIVDVAALSLDPRVFAKDPTTGALGKRLAENIPPATVTVPLLLAQGAADTLVLPPAQEAYVQQACAAGEVVDYRTYAGRDHVGLVETDSPLIGELMAWTTDRFGGEPAGTACIVRAS